VGAGCAACDRHEHSGLMAATILLSVVVLTVLPARWSIGFVCPVLEEVARTFSTSFTQELVHVEHHYNSKLIQLNNPAIQPYLRGVRGNTTCMHWMLGSEAYQSPFLSFFRRCKIHITNNLFSYDNNITSGPPSAFHRLMLNHRKMLSQFW
jgi:hypothetical protein